MARYFSAQRVQELLLGKDEVHRHFGELRDKMCLLAYKTERGASTRSKAFAAA
jgi:hypothetical protein